MTWKKAWILGNGPSRPREKNWLKNISDYGTVYGCNALYRDWEPNHLVVNDWRMMTEIIESDYRGQCHFTEFEPLPIDTFDMMNTIQGFNLDTARYYGSREGATDFVFMGDEAINVFQIIWVGPNTDHISWGLKPRMFGMSSGLCALQLALSEGYEEIAMVGFDGLKTKNYRNLYDGTRGYTYDPAAPDKKRIPEKYVPLEADKWESAYKLLIEENPNTKVNLT
tara:strand:- start:1421 stop:2092 length:672 start_codon:yes stop_codon:yes gene_type:complete